MAERHPGALPVKGGQKFTVKEGGHPTPKTYPGNGKAQPGGPKG